MRWILLFGLLLAIFPTVLVVLWLVYQKGFFDPLECWRDHFWDDNQIIQGTWRHDIGNNNYYIRVKKHNEHEPRHHKHDSHYKQNSICHEHSHNHSRRDTKYKVNNHKHRHRQSKNPSSTHQAYLDGKEIHYISHRQRGKPGVTLKIAW
ncbi:hypothetical protein SLEP1_g32849 [Rubroshorea leprosula]|uniref:Uncharacterized protein n=1 Tax=Rubroshorea leprosula TaxID=152421 RepID=A0AAV5KES8_9ROSI|nr:hypothetical protein SLEP1_g32849 [Rubroshorea leprosula]